MYSEKLLPIQLNLSWFNWPGNNEFALSCVCRLLLRCYRYLCPVTNHTVVNSKFPESAPCLKLKLLLRYSLSQRTPFLLNFKLLFHIIVRLQLHGVLLVMRAELFRSFISQMWTNFFCILIACQKSYPVNGESHLTNYFVENFNSLFLRP